MRRLAPFACLLLPLTIAAQAPPSTSKAEAKAEAKASANSSDSKSKKSSSCQTVTHRKVVVNGKTIVDEKKVDNKPAKGKLPGAPFDIDNMQRDLMKKLQEQMKQQMKQNGGFQIRPPLRVTKDIPGGRNRLRDSLRPNKPVLPSQHLPKAKPKAKAKAKAKAPHAKPKQTKPTRGKLVPRTRKPGDRPRIIR